MKQTKLHLWVSEWVGWSLSQVIYLHWTFPYLRRLFVVFPFTIKLLKGCQNVSSTLVQYSITQQPNTEKKNSEPTAVSQCLPYCNCLEAYISFPVAPGSSFCGTKSSANQILLEASTARLGFINIKLSRLCGCVQMEINTKHKHHSTQFICKLCSSCTTHNFICNFCSSCTTLWRVRSGMWLIASN
jgi:hypothetical protein